MLESWILMSRRAALGFLLLSLSRNWTKDRNVGAEPTRRKHGVPSMTFWMGFPQHLLANGITLG